MNNSVVLLTGFEPFGGETTNPSWDAVRALADRDDGLRAVLLPCEFGSSLEVLRAAVAEHRPALVVATGLAGGRAGVTPERVAVNLDDARIPDNAGAQPIDVPVVPDGPAAYFTGLPVKACVAAVAAAGIPTSVSYTAGTFVCNHVFYGLMHLLATEHPGVRGGFVHVPYAPEQVADRPDVPGLPLATTVDALEIIVRTSLATTADLPVTAGHLH
ncbi:pyroglutamyl-peptidase I [Saccharothrix coeruleofusca]|uniref:Pyrrolidone-carboxylate peptidase n=1 Tax=Saccharothrix coeruleofusca TaxID=33919 RepID=A0A918AGT3_9PSEU|nr:pyroglutamyl-peptidase I [Saccharothrix coeruleofusca]GGP35719.1 pyrrolidone-carboxylate peptidase [Saccharothrix coeruleofusca]